MNDDMVPMSFSGCIVILPEEGCFGDRNALCLTASKQTPWLCYFTKALENFIIRENWVKDTLSVWFITIQYVYIYLKVKKLNFIMSTLACCS